MSHLQLAFERGAHDVSGPIDGRPVAIAVTATYALVNLPGGVWFHHVQIGIPDGGGQMAVIHGLMVDVVGDRVRLCGGG